jgi:hypothetical protein
MRLTWLGWAGAELETEDATVVVDPLEDASAVFAPLGERTARAPLPRVVPPSAGRAVAGLVTHLHRDHADARALAAALAPGSPVLEPPAGGGDRPEGLGLAQAEHELTAAGLDRDVWQCPVVLLADVRSVGVQGDGRTYGHPVVLRPVSSEDAMTADWTRLPYDVLARISTRITNEVPEVNRVVLDVTSKPPGTIEWE